MTAKPTRPCLGEASELIDLALTPHMPARLAQIELNNVFLLRGELHDIIIIGAQVGTALIGALIGFTA